MRFMPVGNSVEAIEGLCLLLDANFTVIILAIVRQ